MTYRRYFKPLIASLVLLSLSGIVGGLGVSYFSTRINSIANDTLPALSHLAMANQYRGTGFIHLVRAMSSDNPEEVQSHEDSIRKIANEGTLHLQAYAKTIRTEENMKLFQIMMADRQVYVELRERVMAEKRNGHQAEALQELDRELMPMYLHYLENGRKLLEYANKDGERQLGEIRIFVIGSIVFALFSSMAIFIAGFFMGYTR